MPQTCTICKHPQRKEIEAALASGTPLRRIASQCGTSDASLRRHKPHMGKALARAQERREIWLGDSLADQLLAIHDETLRLLDQAKRAKNPRVQLAAIREARQNIGGLLAIQQAMPQGSADPPVVFQLPPEAARLLGKPEMPAAPVAPTALPAPADVPGHQDPSVHTHEAPSPALPPRRSLTAGELEAELIERRQDALARSRAFGPQEPSS